jgi:hypothetical protein
MEYFNALKEVDDSSVFASESAGNDVVIDAGRGFVVSRWFSIASDAVEVFVGNRGAHLFVVEIAFSSFTP